jgi:hypothetical protein
MKTNLDFTTEIPRMQVEKPHGPHIRFLSAKTIPVITVGYAKMTIPAATYSQKHINPIFEGSDSPERESGPRLNKP